MKFFGDYHTHTYYSDGRSSVEENIQAALQKELKEVAITDHNFTSLSWGALTQKTFEKQAIEIECLRKRYKGRINILHGVEADIIGLDGSIGMTKKEMARLDILLLGYHSFARPKSFNDWRKIFINSYISSILKPSKAIIKRNTRTLIKAIKYNPIDILTHINHLFKVNCVEVAKVCSDFGTYIELNAKHMSISDDDFQQMQRTGVKFIANSDAHHSSKIGQLDKIRNFLKKHNYDLAKLANYNNCPEFYRRKKEK